MSATYKHGDLVRAGSPPLHGEIVKTSRDGLPRGRLRIRPIAGVRSPREIRVGDVTGHWRKVK